MFTHPQVETGVRNFRISGLICGSAHLCMDYSVWESLSDKVYSGRTTLFREEPLKDAIRKKWREIPQDEVRKAISSWKK